VYFLDLTLTTPQENLALDEALLQTAESHRTAEYLRVWDCPRYCVILGRNCRANDDVWVQRCRDEGIPILRRRSGGGTVLLGPGCLNYAVVLRYDRAPGLDSVTVSTTYCLERVLSAIDKVELAKTAHAPDRRQSSCEGGTAQPPMRPVPRLAGSDLMWNDRKFGGSAQRRQRTHFLHHGTILYQFDIAQVICYLKEPARQPAHRASRGHAAFLTTIPANRVDLGERLREAWNATELLLAPPLELTAALVATRYGQED
jgi:lipoate-protein ligase A